MNCETAREHIDARALGALDNDDARSLDAHLSSCADCSDQAREAEETAAAVAMTVPLVASSAALKSRIMASAAVLTDIGRARAPRWWRAAVAAMFVAGIGVVSWGAFTQSRVNDLEGQNASIAQGATAQAGALASIQVRMAAATNSTTQLRADVATQDAVLDVVLQPDVTHTQLVGTAAAPAAKARCVWSQARAIGAFVADNLPAPPAGAVYQVWVVYERAWANSGTLAVDAAGRGRLIMRDLREPTADDMGAFLGFAVTVEATPDVEQHSGRLVLTSLN